MIERVKRKVLGKVMCEEGCWLVERVKGWSVG